MAPPRDYVSSPFVKRDSFALEWAVSSVVVRNSEVSDSQTRTKRDDNRRTRENESGASLRLSFIVSSCN
jgi:hypothetical protein